MRAWPSDLAERTCYNGRPSVTDTSRRKGSWSCEMLAQEVRLATESDIENMAARLESIWQQGEEAAQQLAIDSHSCHEELSEQLVELREQQEALELENASLMQALEGVVGQLAQWSTANANIFADMAAFNAAATPMGSLNVNSLACSLATFDALSPALTPAAPGLEPSLWSGVSTRNQDKLPEVPAFPFAPAPDDAQEPRKPLSLADALGIGETPAPPPEAQSPLPFVSLEGILQSFDAEAVADDVTDGYIFSITLRKDAGTGLGLATSATENGALRISCILPGGAAEAWNRQWGGKGAAEEVLLPGDVIVNVNGIAEDAAAMELECDRQDLLRLMVVRSDCHVTSSQNVAAVVEQPAILRTLRAEASDFVPGVVVAL